ncbi:iron-containing alcohol dehydrogenase [Mammaliicoccus lentus]|jgi:alcohol dehydrogenase class IV|uniref:iron-containing alcohol dehydrogenase n=1 Tax=Mammaliicoccus lentus TaxID=42858 RepID=UPI001C501DA4|nr:iron-containing alcohol dehydrogenase [Mammaliicoccus lentus]MBW0767303.1 iron-containing alcohol dehydrogenase [Mammaliicoccus lentus]
MNNLIQFNDFYSPEIIRFGKDALYSLDDEFQDNKIRKIFIVSDIGVKKAGITQKLIDIIEKHQISYEVSSDLFGEPTQEDVISNVNKCNEFDADLVIGIGGGASLDVAKATAALMNKGNIEDYLNGKEAIEERTVKSILIPTTSGTGAEVTRNAIFENKSEQLKVGIVSTYLLPDIAIIDPHLTITCPAKVTASSGVDAFTHAFESFISVKSTPLTKIYSEKSMEIFPNAIKQAVHHKHNICAREDMAWVSLLGGVSLANAGVGVVHAMAYPLGGRYHIEHGVANALLLPYVIKNIGHAIENELVIVANLLQLGDYKMKKYEVVDAVSNYLYKLLQELNLPTNLKDLNVSEEDLSHLASQAINVKRLIDNTPYDLTEEMLLEIYNQAFIGGFQNE